MTKSTAIIFILCFALAFKLEEKVNKPAIVNASIHTVNADVNVIIETCTILAALVHRCDSVLDIQWIDYVYI